MRATVRARPRLGASFGSAQLAPHMGRESWRTPPAGSGLQSRGHQRARCLRARRECSWHAPGRTATVPARAGTRNLWRKAPARVSGVEHGPGRLAVARDPFGDLSKLALLLALRVEAQQHHVCVCDGGFRSSLQFRTRHCPPPAGDAGSVKQSARAPADFAYIGRPVALPLRDRGLGPAGQRFGEALLPAPVRPNSTRLKVARRPCCRRRRSLASCLRCATDRWNPASTSAPGESLWAASARSILASAAAYAASVSPVSPSSSDRPSAIAASTAR